MNVGIKQLNQIRSRNILVVCMVVAVIVGSGVRVGAAKSASFELSSSSSSVQTGSEFIVSVFENSDTEAVSTVQADVSYDPSQLQFVSLDTSGSGFDFNQPLGKASGTVSVVAAKLGKTVTGKQLVGRVHFKALAGQGKAVLSVASSSKIAQAPAANDIWNHAPTTTAVSLGTQITTPTASIKVTDKSTADNQTMRWYVLAGASVLILGLFSILMVRRCEQNRRQRS